MSEGAQLAQLRRELAELTQDLGEAELAALWFKDGTGPTGPEAIEARQRVLARARERLKEGNSA